MSPSLVGTTDCVPISPLCHCEALRAVAISRFPQNGRTSVGRGHVPIAGRNYRLRANFPSMSLRGAPRRGNLTLPPKTIPPYRGYFPYRVRIAMSDAVISPPPMLLRRERRHPCVFLTNASLCLLTRGKGSGIVWNNCQIIGKDREFSIAFCGKV